MVYCFTNTLPSSSYYHICDMVIVVVMMTAWVDELCGWRCIIIKWTFVKIKCYFVFLPCAFVMNACLLPTNYDMCTYVCFFSGSYEK